MSCHKATAQMRVLSLLDWGPAQGIAPRASAGDAIETNYGCQAAHGNSAAGPANNRCDKGVRFTSLVSSLVPGPLPIEKPTAVAAGLATGVNFVGARYMVSRSVACRRNMGRLCTV